MGKGGCPFFFHQEDPKLLTLCYAKKARHRKKEKQQHCMISLTCTIFKSSRQHRNARQNGPTWAGRRRKGETGLEASGAQGESVGSLDVRLLRWH